MTRFPDTRGSLVAAAQKRRRRGAGPRARDARGGLLEAGLHVRPPEGGPGARGGGGPDAGVLRAARREGLAGEVRRLEGAPQDVPARPRGRARRERGEGPKSPEARRRDQAPFAGLRGGPARGRGAAERGRALAGGFLRKGMGAERLLDGGRALPGELRGGRARRFASRSFPPTTSKGDGAAGRGRATRISPCGSGRRSSTSRTSSRPRGATSAGSSSTSSAS